MPTYSYECRKCESVVDVFHAMSASPRVKCPSCGSARMKRLLGAGAGLIFKGSGFYQTDYKNNGNGKKDAAPESKSESTTEAKSEPKGDAKSGKSQKSKGGGEAA